MVGLRSVIFIGGGEPTLYSEFERVVQTAAELGLRIGIVSNGSRPGCLSGAAQYLSRGDWIRFSLDAGSDEIFQLAHQPRTPITLHAICEGPRAIKNVNKLVSCGFSFVVIAPEMLRFDPQLTVNYHEIALATRLAKNSDFDYISFKPFLARDMEGKEVLPSRLPNGAHAKKSTSNGPASDDQHFIDFDRLLADPIGKDEILPACSAAIAGDGGGLTNESILRIREGIKEAETLADDHFRVVPSLNLLALFDPEGLASARSQPRRCHMQALRQVVTPTGIYGCPGYRGDRRSLIAARDGYLNVVKYLETVAMTGAQIDRFDASTECRNITCLYSDTNWWLEHLDVDGPIPESFDHADDEIPIFL
jgi:hypothetical protein